MVPDLYTQLKTIRENINGLSKNTAPLWHPLGFVSCVVSNKEDLVTRLHYWPKNQKKPKCPDWPIHTHLFTLTSLVLHGQIKDIQYRPSSGKQYSALSVEYVGVNSKLIPTGDLFDLKVIRETVLQRHGSYIVEEGVFHQSEVHSEDETMTLVQCANPTNRPPIVVAPTEELDLLRGVNFDYLREPFSREVFWEKARVFLTEFMEEKGTTNSVLHKFS